MESIIEMFSGLNTRTRADLLARLFTKNSELISAKRNNSYNVEIPSLELNNYSKAGVETQIQYSLSKAIDESSVRDWVASLKFCTQEQIDKTQKKKQIRDSNSTIPGLDARIRDYIIEQRKKKIAVNFKMIKIEAQRFCPDPDFKASPGWWQNVRRRLKISLRVGTHIIQKLCSQSGQDINDYLGRIQKLKLENFMPSAFKLELLYGNFDEVPLQFDMVSGKTYDFKGKKEICIQTTSGIKMRVTVLMAILSNGAVLPPLFVFKSKKAIAKELVLKYANEALIYSNAKGWISETILLDWFERVWLNLNISVNQKPVLIFDQCKVHTSAQILKFLERKKITYEVIPAGTTGYLQPLDISINRPLKAYIKEKFDKWYMNFGSTTANTTPKGYRRPPSYDNLIRWTIESCKEINEETVIHSFKTTGKN